MAFTRNTSSDLFAVLRSQFGDFSKVYSIGDIEYNSQNAEIIRSLSNQDELKKAIQNGKFNNLFNIEKDYLSLYLLLFADKTRRFAVILDMHDPWTNPQVIATDDAKDFSLEQISAIYPSMNLL